MKNSRYIALFCLALFLIIPISAHAFSVKTGDSVYIADNETIDGNLYAVGSTLTIEGKVKGDVICAGQTININGEIMGDVICAGQTININGEVEGSVRVAGNSLNINSHIKKGLQAFGATITLGANAEVAWDMLIAAANGEMRGKVGGDLHGTVGNMLIAGEIGKDVKIKVDDNENQGKNFGAQTLTIANNASIKGSLNYTANKIADISEDANIAGEVNHTTPQKIEVKNLIAKKAWDAIFSIFSALVVGLVLISLWREHIIKITDLMLAKTSASIGWGISVMFLTPIIVILLMITLIGLPLSIILIALWLIALYISKILVGIMIGKSILEKIKPEKKESLIWAMILGIIVSWFLFYLPFVGWVLSLLAVCLGLGSVWLTFKKA